MRVRTDRWRQLVLVGCFLSLTPLLGGQALASVVRAVAALTFLVVGYGRLRGESGPTVRPWKLVLAGSAIALASAAVRLIHGSRVGDPYVYPSPADLLGYVAYATLFLGCRAFVKSRTNERNTADFVDSMIAVLVTGLVVYSMVLSSYLSDGSIPLVDRLGNLGYSLLTLMLIGGAFRSSFGPGVRNGSYYLMACAVGGLVLNDLFLLWDTTGRIGALAASWVVAPASFFFAAGAITHPGALSLGDPPRYHDQSLTRGRVIFLVIAAIAGPVAFMNPMLHDSITSRLVVGIATCVLALAVYSRMALVILDRERSARRSSELRSLAERLTSTLSSGEMIDTTLEQASRTVTHAGGWSIVLYEQGEGGEISVARSVASHPTLIPTGLALSDSDSALVASCMGSGAATRVEENTYPLHRDGLGITSDNYCVVAVPIPRRAAVNPVLVATSSALITTEERSVLGSLGGQLGLALDGLVATEEAHQRRSDRRFRSLVESSSDLVLVVDESTTVTFASPNVSRLIGVEEDDMVGKLLLDRVYKQDRGAVRHLMRDVTLPWATPRPIEVRLVDEQHDPSWFEIEARDLRSDPEIGGVVVSARDIGARRAAETSLSRSEARFRLMVQHSHDVVAVVGDDEIITYISPSVERILALSVEDVLGRGVFELLSVTETNRIRALLQQRGGEGTVELFVQGGDGDVRAFEVIVTDMRLQPEVAGVVLAMRDITERKSLEDDLRQRALHDDLTGLANRAAFASEVAGSLDDGGTRRHTAAVLFIDLDEFKIINDSLGHLAGDQVLVVVAERIEAALRQSDFAARLGGDEFAVLLSSVSSDAEATRVADRVREEIARPLHVEGHEFHLTASIGIAIDWNNKRTSEDLLKAADLAMYQAKGQGKNQWQLFEHHMEVSAAEELFLKSSLNRAFERDEFVLHYQPIVEISTGQIRGMEALVRWCDPQRGMISPAAFIPAAEQSGIISDLGIWIADRAAHDLAQWRLEGHDLYCSINVSGRQLEWLGFADRFIDLVTNVVDPDAIVVELTESVLARPATRDTFEQLSACGIRVAIDDFGTGYSALSYLQSFPIDLIKIDRAFVTRLGETKDPSLVQAILNVAESIDATTIAEGIETEVEADLLGKLGVQVGQGYLYAKPVPANEFKRLLEAQASEPTIWIP